MTSRRRKPVEKVSIPKGEEFVSLPFVTFIKKRCEKFNVLFLLSPEKDIYRDGDPCDGFFEAPNTYKLEADTERRALEMLKEWGHYNDEAQSRSDKYIKSIK